MADLSTLDGISDARNDLYNKLEKGEINEIRAAQMERVLRGQESLKAHVPIRLLNVVTKAKGGQAEMQVGLLIRALLRFTTGEEPGPAALPAGR
jgi:hypothetical protein